MANFYLQNFVLNLARSATNAAHIDRRIKYDNTVDIKHSSVRAKRRKTFGRLDSKQKISQVSGCVCVSQ